MFENIILTKITAPGLHSKLMPRPRLKELLTGSYAKIWTIVAGPGYSKTTLLMELKEYLNIPCAWYSPDEKDNNFYIFLKYLVQSIKLIDASYFPQLTDVITEYSEYKNTDIKTLFINELAKTGKEIIIIIDNYHELADNKEIQDFIQFLTDYLPPDIYMAISSRNPIPFNLTKLDNVGQLVSITTQDIKLNTDESLALIKKHLKNIKLTKEMADILDCLDGWVFGLLLLIEALRKSGGKIDFDMANFYTLVQNRIKDYFGSELIKCFPDDMISFLLFTAIPDILDYDLCKNLLKFSQTKIDEYTARIPFMENYYIDNKIFYKYHDVFRKFLLNESARQYSETKIKSIHKKLGKYYESCNLSDQAINHYIQAKEYKAALKILEGLLYTFNLKIELIECWLQEFPEELIETEPVLILMRAFAEYEKLNIDRAVYFYKQAEKIYYKRGDSIGLIIIFMDLIKLFKMKNDDNEMKKYLAISKEYEKIIPLKARIWYLRNYASVISDKYEAIETIEKAISLSSSSDDIEMKSSAISMLALLYKEVGDLDKSIYYIEQFFDMNTIKNSYTYSLKSQFLNTYFYKGKMSLLLDNLEDILNWIRNNDFIITNRIFNVMINVADLILRFDNDSYKEIAKNYYQKSLNFINNLEKKPIILKILLKCIEVEFAINERKFPQALKSLNEIFDEISSFGEPILFEADFVELNMAYLYILLLNSNFDDVIKLASDYLKKKSFVCAYQKLKIMIYLCTAYLKSGQIDNGLNILPDITNECISTKNEALLLIFPVITEILLPFLYLLDVKLATDLYKKSLGIYNTDVAPYTLENLLSILPASFFHDNHNLIPETEILMGKKIFLINAFGPIDVTVGGSEVIWERQYLKKIFALLLLSPQGITQDKLIEEIFPQGYKNAEHNLRNLIYYLRKIFDSDTNNSKEYSCIIYENNRYRLNFENEYYIFDVKELLKHHAAGLESLKKNKNEITYTEYKNAISFYKGDLAEGINSYDLNILRENYRRKYIDMLIFLSEYSLRNNLTDEMLNYCDRIFKTDKYEEASYCCLMKYYSRKGRPDLVKKQYQAYKGFMKKELKADVADYVRELYEELIS